MKKYSLLFATGLLCVCRLALAYDGVQISTPPPKPITPETVQSSIENYVEQSVVRILVKQTGEVIQTALKQQDLKLFPQLIYLSAQRTASECINQTDLHKILRNAYDHGMQIADEQRDLKASSATIRKKINDAVDAEVSQIVFEPYYRLIIEHMIQQAVLQQQSILLQKAVEVELQKMVIQQAVMQQALEQQYMKALSAQK